MPKSNSSARSPRNRASGKNSSSRRESALIFWWKIMSGLTAAATINISLINFQMVVRSVQFEQNETNQAIAANCGGFVRREFRLRPNLDADQRTRYFLAAGRFVGGWNQIGSGCRWRSRFHLDRFRSYLDIQSCGRRLFLELHRFVGRWNEASGTGRERDSGDDALHLNECRHRLDV